MGFRETHPQCPSSAVAIAFMIGKWECQARLKLANGEWQSTPGNLGRSLYPAQRFSVSAKPVSGKRSVGRQPVQKDNNYSTLVDRR